MVLSARFEDTDSARPRGERRKLLLETSGAGPGGASIAVSIHNVSSSGLLIETAADLDIGERIDVDLPNGGATTAAVVWSDGAFYGCRLDAPLAEAALSAVRLRASPPRPSPIPTLPTPGEQAFGARLQRLRKAQGLTLANVADRLGVSKPTVWAWEQGRSHPIASRIAALAEALGVPEAEMMAGREGDARLEALLAKTRDEIAAAAGTTADKIRIMIEL